MSFFDAPGCTIQYPNISADGQTLYFVRGLPAGTGYGIYVSHVVAAPGAVVLGLLGLSYAGWRCRCGTA